MTAALSLALWTSAAAPFSPALPDSPALLVTALIAPWLLHLTFVATLIALTLIDLDWFLLPNRLTLTLTLLGLLASLAIPTASGVDLRLATWGVLLGGALPWLVAFTYALVTGRTGRRYCVFGTAGSMNGYTSTTASITLESGLKVSLPSHGPAGFFVDLGVSAAAPT